MITAGFISRDTAAEWFPFLATRYPGRRKAIKDFTHADPDFVFWIFPDGRLYDPRDPHLRHTLRGYRHILYAEPDYCGFLRRSRICTDADEAWEGSSRVIGYQGHRQYDRPNRIKTRACRIAGLGPFSRYNGG